MQLGRTKPEDIVMAINREEEKTGSGLPKPTSTTEAVQPKQNQQITLSLEDKIVVQLDREGALKHLEIKGELKVVVYDPDQSRLIVKTNGIKNPAFKTKLHPKFNQQAWNESGSLVLKEAGKSLPVGSENAPVILKWRMTSKEEKDIPFTVNFWPSNENQQSVVNVEYQAEKPGLVLSDVRIIIPCKSSGSPDVRHVDGSFSFDNKEKTLTWNVEEISEQHPKGSMEFAIGEVDSDTFYPISVLFSSLTPYVNIQVVGVHDVDSNKSFEFQHLNSLAVEKFTVDS